MHRYRSTRKDSPFSRHFLKAIQRGPGDAHESGPAVELESHPRVEALEQWQHQVVADQAWVANAEPLRALHATEHVLCEGGT